ncbi:hypothetical protein [Lactococcus ileimucosae]
MAKIFEYKLKAVQIYISQTRRNPECITYVLGPRKNIMVGYA